MKILSRAFLVGGSCLLPRCQRLRPQCLSRRCRWSLATPKNSWFLRSELRRGYCASRNATTATSMAAAAKTSPLLEECSADRLLVRRLLNPYERTDHDSLA
jgi:hypothetical protein